jgi:alkylhydroperoxidase family enzyme
MPANVFEVFMSEHPPVGDLVTHANSVLWDQTALDPLIKERMRIAAAQAIGCSYCARFRTATDAGFIMDQRDQLVDDSRAVLAENFITAVVQTRGGIDDELTVEMQKHFTPHEFADLVFSLGWFIGMQHVGHMMHWDNSCPVAPIRRLVEAGDAA